MPIYNWRTSAYAMDIYLYGNRTFAQIAPDYVIPVKQYAAQKFTQAQIKTALDNGWITQQEYDDTINYV
jgi:hypothetical protein